MVLFLSAGLVRSVCRDLLEGGYQPDTPAAVVRRASWPDEEAYTCTVATLAETCERHGITKTALLIVGEAAGRTGGGRSRLYDPAFSTGYRKGEENREG
jgi:precorrin-4/cobalt-precorrin-4 C11-methyltransferase